ncbi:MAG: aminotransferase class I/II-fold pyridoxal phosphate-dependent enzyme [Caulobacteraceae bacterium]|nr:aminotransferase class I/II-fold pyridoxal phosphate-dependent enzyme [Caulobacteraceae bacterium]
MPLSHRGQIPAFVVMEVAKAAVELERAGRRVFHMEVGQPSTPAPATVRAAAARALEKDILGYTLATGVPKLRARIAEHYRQVHGIEISPERIVVTTGSSGGFLLAFLAAFDGRAKVAIAAPGYPCYRNILGALDVEVIAVPCGPETHYQLTPALIEEAARLHGGLDGVIVASPSNPTGSIIDAATMKALADYCRAANLTLISDEIYQGLQYGEAPVSAAALDENAIVLNSFSKYFSMTGWRIGWMVVPPDLLRGVERLAQNFFISAPTLSQLGAIAAFDATEELDGHLRRYRDNRDLVLAALPALGINQFAPPDGAFYVYADVSHLTDDSVRFCSDLLAATGVAVTPGVDFDRERGHRTVRISYATDTASVAEAMERMKAFCAETVG